MVGKQITLTETAIHLIQITLGFELKTQTPFKIYYNRR